MAIRHVVDAEGQALAPSPAFAALRDGLFIDDASVDARRGDYARLFDQLEAAGVDRSDLQLAWTFTVASTQDTTADMVRVRDLARDWSAAESLGFRIDRLDEAPEAFPGFAFLVEGVVTVPLFLEEARAGSLLHRGSDGLPVQNGTAEYPFWLLIPSSAAEAPAGVLQYGHGMLGSGEEVLWIDEVQAFAAEANLALLGMDWTGFSHNDTGVVIGTLASGQLHNFQAVPDGLHQAMANFIVGLRTTVGPLNQDPSLQIGGHAPSTPVASTSMAAARAASTGRPI